MLDEKYMTLQDYLILNNFMFVMRTDRNPNEKKINIKCTNNIILPKFHIIYDATTSFQIIFFV